MEATVRGCIHPNGLQLYVRLKVRVGLCARLFGDDMGMPSRISPTPFSSPKDAARCSRRGKGKLDSGPARLCNTSKLVLLNDFTAALTCGELEPDEPADV